MTKKQDGLTAAQKETFGNTLALIVTVICVLVLIGTYMASDLLVWFLMIVNFVFGPACLFFYLIEVKKGVFANTEDPDQDG